MLDFLPDGENVQFRLRHGTRSILFNGPESSSSSNPQSTYNNQATVGDTGSGASVLNIGSGATATAAGGASLSGSNDTTSIQIQNLDSGLVTSFGTEISNLANNSVDSVVNASTYAVGQNSVVASNALVSNVDAIDAATAFGAEVSQDSSGVVDNAIAANAMETGNAFNAADNLAGNAFNAADNLATTGAEQNSDFLAAAGSADAGLLTAEQNIFNTGVAANSDALTQALKFGSEALNQSTAVQSAAVSGANASAQNSQNNLGLIAADFAQITANAAPQTNAAANEIAAGSAPIGGSASPQTTDWTTIALVGTGILSLFVFLKSNGKNA